VPRTDNVRASMTRAEPSQIGSVYRRETNSAASRHPVVMGARTEVVGLSASKPTRAIVPKRAAP